MRSNEQPIRFRIRSRVLSGEAANDLEVGVELQWQITVGRNDRFFLFRVLAKIFHDRFKRPDMIASDLKEIAGHGKKARPAPHDFPRIFVARLHMSDAPKRHFVRDRQRSANAVSR